MTFFWAGSSARGVRSGETRKLKLLSFSVVPKERKLGQSCFAACCRLPKISNNNSNIKRNYNVMLLLLLLLLFFCCCHWDNFVVAFVLSAQLQKLSHMAYA